MNPDLHPVVLRRRPRPLLSCTECQRRKLRCDRCLPCDQCKKGLHTDQCVYQENVRKRSAGEAGLSDPSQEDMPATTPINANTDTQANLANSTNSTTAVTPDSSESHPQKRNYQMLLMSEFDEALDFMQEAFTQPSMSPVLNECKLYCRQFHKQLKIADEQSRREEKPPPAAILAVLPSRGRCAQFVNLYFEYFENTYRILHVPLFMRDYNLFWDAENDRATRFYSFIPQLAAVVAIMASLDWDGDETMGERPLGGRLSTMIEDWLRGRTVQRLGHSRGSVSVRGDAELPCDPSELPGVSIFEDEQRRRLWMTVMEMDLQASIICGRMPSAYEANFTCWSPGNFRDEDLCEEMAEYPAPRPLDEWTDSLVQAILGRPLSLRLKAMRVMAGITGSSRLSSALEIAEQLERFIDALPDVLRIQRSRKHGFSRVFRLVLCDLHLRRPLICLWQKLASMSFILQNLGIIWTDVKNALRFSIDGVGAGPDVRCNDAGAAGMPQTWAGDSINSQNVTVYKDFEAKEDI
ncbi:transcriptional control protein [Rasamsonia emersonii CBS 393.64]|uniref:Transcriptional control protein n=1 Tax=Rasamsonia emersonii (strain ATCC 16479 / CBS 393.64 / IMI 116815) TaxID=1408163 RepID=A0A0F4Z3W2_RASE3|nr:transcriptional control protein [Rasamsonia emersonii CBS 393.64]KKA24583.1 transcriptional control protein [Rasamsonia emersonii CBS 393.64]